MLSPQPGSALAFHQEGCSGGLPGGGGIAASLLASFPSAWAVLSQPLCRLLFLRCPFHAGAAQHLARLEFTIQPVPTHRQVLIGPHSTFFVAVVFDFILTFKS